MPASATATEVQPRSVEEMRDALNRWISAGPRHTDFPIKITRVSRSEGLVVLRCRSSADIRIELLANALVCENANRRISVLIDDFDVFTKFEAKQLFVIFQLRHKEAARALKERLFYVEKTRHPNFVSRALNALAELERELPSERIEEASTAPNDFLVLVNALSAAGVATQMAEKDPLAAAKLRGVENQQELITNAGGVLSAEEAAQILGISRQAVDKRRRQGQLIALAQGRRGYAYPGFQFENGKTIPHLEQVLEALNSHDSWMQLAFFANPNTRLHDRTPLQALRSGEIAEVTKAAMTYGEQGAT